MADIEILVNYILSKIVGEVHNTSIIKVHSENLEKVGEISFPINLLAWRDFINKKIIADCSSRNILEYYLNRSGELTENLSEEELNQKALALLKCSNCPWPINKACLIKDRVCLFIERSSVIASIIENVLLENESFGKNPSKNIKISLEIKQDSDSSLTTMRLGELRNFAENILKLQGYEISKENSDLKFLLTSKSQGPVEDGFKKIVCGVVKNSETESKETRLSFDSYLKTKVDEIEKLDEGRLPGTQNQNKQRLENIAKAVITFEFLGFRPSRSITIGSNKNIENEKLITKTGAFVLYNIARIEAIFRTFRDKQSAGFYSDIPDVEHVNFTKLKLELEWNLIWNFVVGYKEALLKSARLTKNDLELCPQHLTSFLSNWSRQFSIYYHRTRILTDGQENLLSTMVARIYLLKVLHIIVKNALRTMNLVSISSM